MDHGTYLRHFLRESDALSSAAAGHLDLEVPTCPGWRVRDVVGHLAQVYEHKIRCTLEQAEPDPWPPTWPKSRDLLDWLLDARDRIYRLLLESGPTAPSATWWPSDQTTGFWARRMALETAVHRVDVELSQGHAGPVAEALALDGIDEILVVMLAGDWSDAPQDDRGSGLVQLDVSVRQWLVEIAPEEVTVAEPDRSLPQPERKATLSGAASPVFLWLWGRVADSAVERSGDAQVLNSMRRRLTLATQ